MLEFGDSAIDFWHFAHNWVYNLFYFVARMLLLLRDGNSAVQQAVARFLTKISNCKNLL